MIILFFFFFCVPPFKETSKYTHLSFCIFFSTFSPWTLLKSRDLTSQCNKASISERMISLPSLDRQRTSAQQLDIYHLVFLGFKWSTVRVIFFLKNHLKPNDHWIIILNHCGSHFFPFVSSKFLNYPKKNGHLLRIYTLKRLQTFSELQDSWTKLCAWISTHNHPSSPIMISLCGLDKWMVFFLEKMLCFLVVKRNLVK